MCWFSYEIEIWLSSLVTRKPLTTCRLTQETYSMLKTAIRKCFVGQQKKTIELILLCLLNSNYRCANLLTRLYLSIMILLRYLKYGIMCLL